MGVLDKFLDIMKLSDDDDDYENDDFFDEDDLDDYEEKPKESCLEEIKRTMRKRHFPRKRKKSTSPDHHLLKAAR